MYGGKNTTITTSNDGNHDGNEQRRQRATSNMKGSATMTIYDNGNRSDNDNDYMKGSNMELTQPLTQKNAYMYFDATIPIATRIVVVYADNTTTIYQQRATSNTATVAADNNESDV